ncbi:hypothetical protein D3C76_1722960 [compost metagenome]
MTLSVTLRADVGYPCTAATVRTFLQAGMERKQHASLRWNGKKILRPTTVSILRLPGMIAMDCSMKCFRPFPKVKPTYLPSPDEQTKIN